MIREQYQWFDSSRVRPEHVEIAKKLANSNTSTNVFLLSGANKRPSEPLVTCHPNGRDWYVGRYIGDLYFENVHIQIQPRMGLHTVFSWLDHEPSRIVSSKTPSGAKWTNKLLIFEILFHAFKVQLAVASTHGVPRQEKVETVISHRLHGALNVRETVRHYRFSQRQVASSKRRRSRDTPIARIILAAHRILTQRLQNAELPMYLADVINELASESHADFTTSLPEILRTKLTPATYGFLPLALFCHRIVKELSLTPEPDAERFENNVLLDVSELFEHHVLRSLCRAFPMYNIVDGNATESRGGTSADHLLRSRGKQFRALYPDFLITDPRDGHVRMVVDAKYKRSYANAREPLREDAYQMTSYLDHFGQGLPLAGALISPVNDGEDSSGEKYLLNSGKSITVGAISAEIDKSVLELRNLLQQDAF